MNLVQIERRAGLTPESFKQEYLIPDKPVIITDLVKDWPALEKWTFDYFKSTYGTVKVPMVDKHFHTPGEGYMVKKQIPFRDYLEIIEKGPTDMRLFAFNFFNIAPELKKDFEFPNIMKGFLKNFAFMFFGGQTSVTPIHYDIDLPSNFLTHFQTKKRIVLFDQYESKKLYHHPYTVQSPVDIQYPDYEKFPALKNANGQEGIIGHGETIYIPPYWWHYIEYVESGFSLALRAHGSITNQLMGAKNLVQHSIVDKGMNKILGDRWKDWKNKEAQRRASPFV